MVEKKFLPPQEITKSYPQVSKIWSAQQIGYLFNLGLIDGFKTRRSSKVKVSDVLEMLEFRLNLKK